MIVGVVYAGRPRAIHDATGVTKATNSAAVAFCHECHVAGEDNDYMLLIPDEYRVK